MEKLNYKISSRTAILLGRENVSNVDGALIELIKNSYDADASFCYLYFDIDEDSIYIIDDGYGMTKEIIKNCWLMIGTDNKMQDYETNKKRIKSGEKGIGRLALDRLGSKYSLYTKNNSESHDDKYYKLSTNWNDFEIKGKSLEEIDIELDLVKGKLSDCLKETIIYDLEKDKIIDSLNKSGTIIKIDMLRDVWNNTNFEKINSVLVSLIPPVEQSDFKIYIKNSNDNIATLVEGVVSDEYDYKIKADFDGDKFYVNLIRNEFDTNKIPKELFDMNEFKIFPYRYDDFLNKEFNFEYSINELMNTKDKLIIDQIRKIGPFIFNYIFMKNSLTEDSENIYYYKEISRNRKQWLKNYSGIKIYRDNFVVRPYGDPSAEAYDWVGLDAIRAKSPGGISHKGFAWRVSNSQGQGTLFISRTKNYTISDKSNREGIINNEFFNQLKKVIEKILFVFEKDRSYIGFNMKKFYDLANEKSRKKEEGLNLAKTILNKNDVEKNGELEADLFEQNKMLNDEEKIKKLAEAVNIYEEEKEEYISELKMLRSLASNGLITTSIVHDLKTINASLLCRSNLLKEHIKNNKSELINEGLKILKSDDEFLYSWITVITNQTKHDRRNRYKYDIVDVIEKTISILQPILLKKKVNVLIKKPQQVIFKKMFITDFETIIYNLIINSIESFKVSSSTVRNIVFIINDEKEKIVIDYEDSGDGLCDKFKDPYDIFNYGVTSKVDKDGNIIGSGLGMYIVSSTIREYNGEYKLLDTKGKFKMQISIPKEASRSE